MVFLLLLRITNVEQRVLAAKNKPDGVEHHHQA